MKKLIATAVLAGTLVFIPAPAEARTTDCIFTGSGRLFCYPLVETGRGHTPHYVWFLNRIRRA